MLTAPLFSRIIVRDAQGRYPRAILQISLQDGKRAEKFMNKLLSDIPNLPNKLRIDRGRVIAEGWNAVTVARELGWPEAVVDRLHNLAEARGTPGVNLTENDVYYRKECAAKVISAVKGAERRALSPR